MTPPPPFLFHRGDSSGARREGGGGSVVSGHRRKRNTFVAMRAGETACCFCIDGKIRRFPFIYFLLTFLSICPHVVNWVSGQPTNRASRKKRRPTNATLWRIFFFFFSCWQWPWRWTEGVTKTRKNKNRTNLGLFIFFQKKSATDNLPHFRLIFFLPFSDFPEKSIKLWLFLFPFQPWQPAHGLFRPPLPHRRMHRHTRMVLHSAAGRADKEEAG